MRKMSSRKKICATKTSAWRRKRSLNKSSIPPNVCLDKKARDVIAGFCNLKQCKSASRETSSGPAWCGRPGRHSRLPCQDAHPVRSGRDGGRPRSFSNIRGSQHLKLHRRDRKTRQFIGRQLGGEGGAATCNEDRGGGDR